MIYRQHGQVWKSLLAEQLRQSEGAATVEEAAFRLVKRKLKNLNLYRPPFDLPLIASAVGILPDFKLSSMEQPGLIVRSNGKHHIKLKDSDSSRRRRFTAAHEIAHKMIDGVKVRGTKFRSDYDSNVEQAEEEKLCDLVATILLGLYDEFLQPVLTDRGYSFETIEHVRDTFDVSFEAAARGLTELCDEPVAVLFCSPEGNSSESDTFTIGKFVVSTTFPFYIYAKTWRLPFLCLRRAAQGTMLIRTNEHWQVEDGLLYRCEFAAKRMFFYVNKARIGGVVVVITNPTKSYAFPQIER